MREELKKMLEMDAEHVKSEVPWEKMKERMLAESANEAGLGANGVGLPGRKRRSFGQRVAVATAASVLLCGGVVGSGFVSPAMADVLKTMPVIGKVFEGAGDEGLRNASKANAVTTLNQEVEDQGIKLTVSEVYADSARFSVAVVGEFPAGVDGSSGITDMTYQISGEQEVRLKPEEGKSVSMWDWDAQQEGTFTGVFAREGGSLPEDFTVKMHITEMGGVKGSWQFEIPISKAKAQAVSKTVDVDRTKTLDGTDVTVKRIVFAPSVMTVSVHAKGPKVKDLVMNQVGSVSVHGEPPYTLTDEKGNSFGMLSTGDRSYQGNYTYNLAEDEVEYKFTFSPQKQLPEKLTLTFWDSEELKFEVPIQ